MFIIIVGAGKVGKSLARKLQVHKHNIVLIESDPKTAQRVAEENQQSLVIYGDGCDPKILEDAGAERAEVVAAVTGDDEDNLIICQMAKENFDVPRTLARINNPRNEETFHRLGIDGVTSTSIIAKLIEEESTFDDIVTQLTLKRGRLSVVEIILEDESPAANKEVRELNLPEESILTTVIRNNNIIFPKGSTILESHDTIVALTLPGKEKELKIALTGKT
jgi:trk system potassium uptake protein